MSDFAQTVKQQADIVKVIEGRRTTPASAPSTKKNRLPFPSTPSASSTTASVARLRATFFLLSPRLRT
jgi:hypothetical protein